MAQFFDEKGELTDRVDYLGGVGAYAPKFYPIPNVSQG